MYLYCHTTRFIAANAIQGNARLRAPEDAVIAKIFGTKMPTVVPEGIYAHFKYKIHMHAFYIR